MQHQNETSQHLSGHSLNRSMPQTLTYRGQKYTKSTIKPTLSFKSMTEEEFFYSQTIRESNTQMMFHTCVTLAMGFSLGMGLCLILSKGMTQMEKGRCKLPQYSQTHKVVNLQSFWGDTSYCVDKRYL